MSLISSLALMAVILPLVGILVEKKDAEPADEPVEKGEISKQKRDIPLLSERNKSRMRRGLAFLGSIIAIVIFSLDTSNTLTHERAVARLDAISGLPIANIVCNLLSSGTNLHPAEFSKYRDGVELSFGFAGGEGNDSTRSVALHGEPGASGNQLFVGMRHNLDTVGVGLSDKVYFLCTRDSVGDAMLMPTMFSETVPDSRYKYITSQDFMANPSFTCGGFLFFFDPERLELPFVFGSISSLRGLQSVMLRVHKDIEKSLIKQSGLSFQFKNSSTVDVPFKRFKRFLQKGDPENVYYVITGADLYSELCTEIEASDQKSGVYAQWEKNSVSE